MYIGGKGGWPKLLSSSPSPRPPGRLLFERSVRPSGLPRCLPSRYSWARLVAARWCNNQEHAFILNIMDRKHKDRSTGSPLIRTLGHTHDEPHVAFVDLWMHSKFKGGQEMRRISKKSKRSWQQGSRIFPFLGSGPIELPVCLCQNSRIPVVDYLRTFMDRERDHKT